MKLKSIRIRNFRSIKDDFEIIGMEHGISIVGPNSSGKTNVLKAIEMFFTGLDNRYKYNIKSLILEGNRQVLLLHLLVIEIRL